MRGQVMSVLRQVTVRMEGQDGLTECEKDERSVSSEWVIKR
jgi:hypothetical protein